MTSKWLIINWKKNWGWWYRESLEPCWCNEVIQIFPRASAIKLQFALSQNIGLQYQKWSVCMLCSHAVSFPHSKSSQKLYRESQEHPVLCILSMIGTYFVLLFLPVNSSAPNDELFAEESVFNCRKNTFQRIGILVENDNGNNSNAFYCWEFFTVYMDLLSFIWFSQKHMEVISQGLLCLLILSRCGSWHSKRLNGGRANS